MIRTAPNHAVSLKQQRTSIDNGVADVTCAPITRTVRGTRSEVEVDLEEGLLEASVITFDNIVTLPKYILASGPVGQLGFAKRAQVDRALRYALDIQY
ncbi:MAG TPA: type II toxin-antitoxin system PemK/MazF family toxin [Acidimicrobiales bacterium]|nr:type II toxin-antitoxin system PemK/MazF family toxin [Acidimicrobiales bacterium]